MNDRRVKVVEYAERWTSGGIESYILNLVKRLDRDVFDIRIVVAQKETDIYDKELAFLGISVESILTTIESNPIHRMVENRKLFKQYFLKNPCDVLHLHICQGVALSYAKMAKEIGIPRLISHCHNTDFGDGNRIIKLIGHNIGKIIYSKYPDKMIACSDVAAQWLYPQRKIDAGKVVIEKLLVDVDDYIFDVDERNDIRSKYGIASDERVYLNIGRLHYQKNQKFLLDVFCDILKYEGHSWMIIIGEGELHSEIHSYAKALGIINKIIFIDRTREIRKYMSMSDVFILPSLYEGNPIVGTEAQANGLPCVFSDSITKMAKVLDSSHYISLTKTEEEWSTIIRTIRNNDDITRKAAAQIMKRSGYTINDQVDKMQQMYLS